MSHIKAPLPISRFASSWPVHEGGKRLVTQSLPELSLHQPPLRQPLGALPARQRRQRLLIVGFGDVGQRASQLLGKRVQQRALTRNADPAHLQNLRQQGVTPLIGDLDAPRTLKRLGALASWVLHLAPPPSQGRQDDRTRALARAWLRAQGQRRRRLRQQAPVLKRRLDRLRWRHQATALRALAYTSTTGVYGDCGGEWVPETRAANPQSDRALRRVSAERSLLALASRSGHAVRVARLRAPGIYAPNREGGTPRGRLARGTPCLRPEDDVFTNHIHADDLARAMVLALLRSQAQRAFNVCDDTQMKAGDYFDAAADLYGLPRPPRLPASELKAQVSPMQWSFLRESRRLVNSRMKRELRLVLRHPDVLSGLSGAHAGRSSGAV